MEHSKEFEQLVKDIQPNVKEITIPETLARIDTGATLIDVREDSEWNAAHAAQAKHLGRGVIERDIVWQFPDKDTELILYCGGGFRSALAADAAQKMGYKNVLSLAGGYKAMVAAGWRMEW